MACGHERLPERKRRIRDARPELGRSAQLVERGIGVSGREMSASQRQAGHQTAAARGQRTLQDVRGALRLARGDESIRLCDRIR